MGYKDVLTIGDIGSGAIEEQFNRALTKVLENIEDPATEATNVRKIKLDISIKPTKDRNLAEIEIKCSEGLAPVKSDKVSVLIDRDHKGDLIMKSKEPENQLILDEIGDERHVQ
ncbi:MAG: hypothetical protein PQJ49_11215 [Sphaerochaetaceae bacterium]|nr:hypothetical protein [Sphaerochaetaceae bacterium]